MKNKKSIAESLSTFRNGGKYRVEYRRDTDTKLRVKVTEIHVAATVKTEAYFAAVKAAPDAAVSLEQKSRKDSNRSVLRIVEAI